MREIEISYAIEMMICNDEWVVYCDGERTIEDARYALDSIKMEMPDNTFRIMECTSVIETTKKEVQ